MNENKEEKVLDENLKEKQMENSEVQNINKEVNEAGLVIDDIKTNEEVLSASDVEKHEENQTVNVENKKKKGISKSEILQFIKFLCFSISAGVIQMGSFALMYDLIGWKEWWAAHLISLTLSVIWNFTFNRKFTFKSASNVPLAMTLVLIYYCIYTPCSVFGGNALKGIGWNGTLVEAIMMVINFATEFVWDKFIVFNDKLMSKIEDKLKIKKNKKES